MTSAERDAVLVKVAEDVADLKRVVGELLERYGPVLEMVEARTKGPRLFRQRKEAAGG